MHRFTRITYPLLISSFLLSACHHPERVEMSQPTDSQLSCEELDQEIARAQQAKIAAREHDRFEMRYILIVPAVVSAYNFDKAEKAAQARIEYLEQFKGTCKSHPQPKASMNGMSGGMPGGIPGGFPGQPMGDPSGMPGGNFPGQPEPYIPQGR